VVQFCDPQLGFGTGGFEADVERLEKAVQQVNELIPDIVLIAGDMVNVATDENVATFLEIISHIKVPVLLTPGNHDLLEPVNITRLQRYRSLFGEDFQVIECKKHCIISANSLLWRQEPWEETYRHDSLLHNALQEAKSKEQSVIILTHIPPFVSSIDEEGGYYNLSKAKREEILQLFDENGIIFWLAGHTHRTSQRNYGQIIILNGETTCSNFDGRPYGFRLLTIYSDRSFDWNFIELD
jgi:alkaline phosphatase D